MSHAEQPLPPVVIVDDQADDLYLLSDRLRRARVGNPLVTFQKASDAMAFLAVAFDETGNGASGPPCIIITDLKMPGLDGFQFTAWVKGQPCIRDVPVIAISDGNDARDSGRILRIGAANYFAKYPRGEILADIIAKASSETATRMASIGLSLSQREGM